MAHNEQPLPEPRTTSLSTSIPQVLDQVRRSQDKPPIGPTGAEQRVAALGRDLGERYGPLRCSFDTYQVYDGRQTHAIRAIAGWVTELHTRVAGGRGLVLYGSVGTGKDHLLAATLYQAAVHFPTRWANAQELYAGARDRMDTAKSEAEWLRTWTDPIVLGLSDPVPPAGELSAWRLELLYRLVDRRYRRMRPTWATVNVKDAADADKRLTSPVWDRLQDGALLIPCFWPSWRERDRR